MCVCVRVNKNVCYCICVCVYWVCHSQDEGDCVTDCYIILLMHWLHQWLFKTAKLFFEGHVLYFRLLMEVNHNQAFYDKYYPRCSYYQ